MPADNVRLSRSQSGASSRITTKHRLFLPPEDQLLEKVLGKCPHHTHWVSCLETGEIKLRITI